ncbi:uncharacterized protein A4U43_C08F19220 [Asparagus officinalis]|nr:uncharacterized protein A4U43_C08F19220 [Asparagus officinalis]
MAVDLCEHEHRRILQEHRPDAVIADVPFWWTTSIARDLGVPRITWHSVGVFPQLVMNSLFEYRNEIIGTKGDVIIKDLPGPNLKMPVSELPEFAWSSSNFIAESWGNMKKAQLEGYGVVVNTFHKIEQAYCDQYRMTDGKRVWFVGPVGPLATWARKAVAEAGLECLKWLGR